MSNVFEDAADYLMEHGWTQHMMKAADGSVCAMGALWEVAPEEGKVTEKIDGITTYRSPEGEEAAIKLRKYLTFESNTPLAIARWNDHPDRTAEDVILAFKELANE